MWCRVKTMRTPVWRVESGGSVGKIGKVAVILGKVPSGSLQWVGVIVKPGSQSTKVWHCHNVVDERVRSWFFSMRTSSQCEQALNANKLSMRTCSQCKHALNANMLSMRTCSQCKHALNANMLSMRTGSLSSTFSLHWRKELRLIVEVDGNPRNDKAGSRRQTFPDLSRPPICFDFPFVPTFLCVKSLFSRLVFDDVNQSMTAKVELICQFRKR